MGHWYDSGGCPRYTLTGANGNVRDTTLRDARKLNLYPSYSTVVQAVLAKPGLDRWKQTQMLNAIATTPYDMFDESGWQKKVIHKAASIGREASERGTEIHDLLEQAVLNKEVGDKDRDIVQPVYDFLLKNFRDDVMVPETSFVHSDGFGGKCDLSSNTASDGWVLDFKTKEFDGTKKIGVYAEHSMQLAAYREGLDLPNARCYNLFISITHPGVFQLYEHKQEDLEKAYKMFQALLTYWQLNNNYKPGG